MWSKQTTIYLGNTIGQLIPWKCSQGHVNQVSSYSGNLVDGYQCPTCRKQRIQQQQRRRQLKKKDDQFQQELKRRQKELQAKQEEIKKLQKIALFIEKKLTMSDYTKTFFKEFLQQENMKLLNVQINEGMLKMTVSNYDNKFLILPKSITNEEYKEQRKNNPNLIYGKVQFQAFSRQEKGAKKQFSEHPNLNISFPLSDKEKQKLQEPNLRAEKMELKKFFSLASEKIFR